MYQPNLFEQFLMLGMRQYTRADYLAQREEQMIDDIAKQAMRAKYVVDPAGNGSFQVGRFTVTTDGSWEAKIEANGRVLLDYAADGDGHCYIVTRRSYNREQDWVSAWRQDLKATTSIFRRPACFSSVTRHTP